MFQNNRYLNKLNVRDFSFFGQPEKRSIYDYRQVYKKINSLCSSEKKILSAYTFGQVKAPGISDIDLIFVLKNGAKLPRFLRKTALDSSFGYILVHPFFIVPEDFMENIAYIYPNSDLNLIYGKEIDIKKLSKSELELVYQYLINDVVLRHFPSDYLNVILSKGISLRLSLLRLNALHHSLDIFRKISGVKKREWAKISDDVSNLREEWFETSLNTAKSRIVELLKMAVYVSLDFVNEYSKFFCNKIPESKQSNLLFKGIQNRISFVDDWCAEDSLSEMIGHYNKYKNVYSVLPKALSWQLCAYSSAKGPLSEYIGKRLSAKCNVTNIKPTLVKRIQLLNYQVEYAMKLKHSHYPCFFPLGFKNTKGMKNKFIYAYILLTDNSLFRRSLNLIRTNLKFMHI